MRSRMRGPTMRGLGLAVGGLVLSCGALACGGATGPEHENVRIVLGVTGGFAGVDWQVTIDGRAGEIVGDRCERELDCDWSAGELLAEADEIRLLELRQRFVEAEFLELQTTNFGVQCCDQFVYELTFVDEEAHKTAIGSDGTLPPSILALVQEVRQFVSDARGA